MLLEESRQLYIFLHLFLLKYLHIFYENSSVAVEYRRGDGEVQKIYMPENADSYDRDDIGRFKGLEVLNLEKSELFASNLQGMNELTELRLCNSPDVIVEYLPHPEKLKTLESYSAKNIDGIEAFSNLENLSITCSSLLGKEMTEIKSIADLKKLKSLFSQLYEYAMKNDICSKDYSEFVDIVKYKDKNPDKRDHNKFTKEEIERLWTLAEDPHYQIVLMLIYNGCRISEFLDLKKEDVHLDEQYFDVIASKTENGLRKVPIADKLLPFYKAWFDGSECEYLLHTPDQKHFDYRNYYDSYFTPLMEQLGFDHKPHDTRHTCISKLTEAHVDQTMIKKIVGHSGAMTLTERVYTHLDIETLVEAINKIT